MLRLATVDVSETDAQMAAVLRQTRQVQERQESEISRLTQQLSDEGHELSLRCQQQHDQMQQAQQHAHEQEEKISGLVAQLEHMSSQFNAEKEHAQSVMAEQRGVIQVCFR